MQFIAFPDRRDALLSNAKATDIEVSASGSIGIYKSGKCVKTNPNETLNSNERLDWCSNLVPANDAKEKPWIMYSIKNKAMKLNGYAVRNGCCWETCCCIDDGKTVEDVYCCCRLYSFSLLGSNDNRTWKTLHKIEKDPKFKICQFKSYEISTTESFKYIRFVADEPWPNCPFCIQINQIELYGESLNSISAFSSNADDDDETVSIIGKLNNRDQM